MSKCIKCGSYAFNLYKEDIDQGSLCDVHYWQGRAHRAEALAEQQPAQQEPVAWRNAALRVGEDLCSVGPFGYYDMTAEQWLDWALSVVTVHTPPAQRKPLTDDPLQGAVDWLLEADGEYFCTATVQRTLRIGYNRAKRLCDTAKERAAHGIKENT